MNDIKKIYLITLMSVISMTSKAQFTETSTGVWTTTDNTIGIGTTSPLGDLHVHKVENQVNSATSDLVLSQFNAYNKISGLYTGTFIGGISFSTSNGVNKVMEERMRILGNGNVGIGTTSPLGDLHVHRVENEINSATSDLVLSQFNAYNKISGLYTGTFKGGISFSTSNGTNKVMEERMRILANGFVGVGTTSPESKLHLKDGVMQISHSSSAPTIDFVDDEDGDKFSLVHYRSENRFYIYDTDDNKVFAIDQDGKVGIGATSPLEKFHLKDGSVRISHSSSAPTINFVDDVDGDKFSLAHHRSDNKFYIYDTDDNQIFAIDQDGKVGIGTTTTGSHKLAVHGSIGAREIKVESGAWSDFVFEEDYELKSLEETEEFIAENKHLPEVPSESEVLENGINLGEMDAKLLQKIEELTLYLIDQNKELKFQKELIEQLQQEVSNLKETSK